MWQVAHDGTRGRSPARLCAEHPPPPLNESPVDHRRAVRDLLHPMWQIGHDGDASCVRMRRRRSTHNAGPCSVCYIRCGEALTVDGMAELSRPVAGVAFEVRPSTWARAR